MIKAACEVDPGPGAGLIAIRDWVFDTEEEVLISREIPCCSERADIAAAFPEFPITNTLNSGWGTIFIHAENVGLEAADTEPDPDATPLPPPRGPSNIYCDANDN